MLTLISKIYNNRIPVQIVEKTKTEQDVQILLSHGAMCYAQSDRVVSYTFDVQMDITCQQAVLREFISVLDEVQSSIYLGTYEPDKYLWIMDTNIHERFVLILKTNCQDIQIANEYVFKIMHLFNILGHFDSLQTILSMWNMYCVEQNYLLGISWCALMRLILTTQHVVSADIQKDLQSALVFFNTCDSNLEGTIRLNICATELCWMYHDKNNECLQRGIIALQQWERCEQVIDPILMYECNIQIIRMLIVYNRLEEAKEYVMQLKETQVFQFNALHKGMLLDMEGFILARQASVNADMEMLNLAIGLLNEAIRLYKHCPLRQAKCYLELGKCMVTYHTDTQFLGLRCITRAINMYKKYKNDYGVAYCLYSVKRFTPLSNEEIEEKQLKIMKLLEGNTSVQANLIRKSFLI